MVEQVRNSSHFCPCQAIIGGAECSPMNGKSQTIPVGRSREPQKLNKAPLPDRHQLRKFTSTNMHCLLRAIDPASTMHLFRNLFLFLAAIAVGDGLRAGTQTYPANANVVDVTQPPYSAKGDGVSDDTEAIQRALNENVGWHLPEHPLRCL